MQRDVPANGTSCKDVFANGEMDEHANIYSLMEGWMNIHLSRMDEIFKHANVEARINV